MPTLKKCWGLNKLFKGSLVWAFGAVSIVFTFLPESIFEIIQWNFIERLECCSKIGFNIVCNRVGVFIAIWILCVFAYWLYMKYRKTIIINGKDYIIKVEYNNLLKTQNCKRVINFDECFTTTVGQSPGDIKPTSICGQYLKANPNIDIKKLIIDSGLKPEQNNSKYGDKVRYKLGSIVPNGDDLLLAFVPLDESGRGIFNSVMDYRNSLLTMWDEIDKHYGQCDVCIPILGSGITRIGNGSTAQLSQQELLDMIIWSYKMNPHKLKKPYKLRIICKELDDFSLNDIDTR